MSRIGKQLIVVPDNVELKFEDDFIVVKGPKGELRQKKHPSVQIEKNDEGWRVKVRDPENKKQRSLWGLYKRLIDNMIHGVVEGYSKKLRLVGVGYRVAAQGSTLNFSLGFSHPVKFALPEGISATIEDDIITVSGIDKQMVGEVSARVRALRKPEPYKGKGIRYLDEVVRKKAGKSAKTA